MDLPAVLPYKCALKKRQLTGLLLQNIATASKHHIYCIRCVHS